MRSHDWSKSPLGWPQTWPVLLYNDAYAEILALKHPVALGARLQDVWAEIWGDILPLVERALAGEVIWHEDWPVVVSRHGYDEQAWVTFSWSPVRDDSGRVAGLFCSIAETTRRVQTQAALRESEARFEAITNSIDQVVWSARPDGVIDYCNRRWYEFTGATDESTVGDAWVGMLHPDDQTRAWNKWRHSLATGQPYRIEYRLRHRSGEYRWVLASAQTVRDDDGRITRWYGTATDIQEIVDAREVMARSRDELERLVSERTAERDQAWINAPGLLMVVGTDGRIKNINPGWTQWFGWLEDQMLGHSLLEFVHPDDRDAGRAAFECESKSEQTSREARFRRTDGLHQWVSWKTSRVDESVVIVGRDITEEKRRNDSLLLHENIVQSHSSPICAVDTEYRLIAFNRALSAILFRVYGHRTRIGQVLSELPPRERSSALHTHITRALQGEIFTVTEEFDNPDLVKTYFEVSYSPLRDARGRITGAFRHSKDISQKLRAQVALGATHDALRQAQKMEAVGQLTGGLAHDFNNLLAGIMGNLEVIKRKLDKGQTGDLDRFIAMAQGGAKRAASLTHRLLAFSRRQTLDPKLTDVKHLIAGMEELVRRTVGPSIEVETVHAEGLTTSRIDANELENAVLNMAINARDAMPDGGKITIEIANRGMNVRTARERGLAPGQYISVCVSDTGSGMRPDVVARAFDPFFTTKPIGVGTGLGLSMIHGFAKQSGGSVHIDSEVGSGTKVCIYLPSHSGVPEENTALEPPTASTFTTGESVLIVDDEPSVRLFVAESLSELGLRTLEAEDGPSALQILRSDERIDLLITDVGLPGGLNGRQVADAARALRPGLKILFVTGYAESAIFNRCHIEPGMYIMTKPFSLDDLVNRVQELVGVAEGIAPARS